MALPRTDAEGARTRPQTPGDTRTIDDDGPFHGTNPWSGPYFVLAIMGAVLVVVLGIVVAFIVHWF
jgi:hypothetical protein